MSTRIVPGAARGAAVLLVLVSIAGARASAQQPAAPQVQRAAPAPVRPESFRMERTVFPGAAGANRLTVDVPLLVGAERFRALVAGEGAGADRRVVATGGLGDLRLYDAAQREVPYLLVTPPSPTPVWQGGRMLAVAATDTTSGFEVDLGSVTQSDRLRLEGMPAPFLKRLRLEGSGDRERWTLLVPDGTLFDLPDEGLRMTELEYPAGPYRYLRVTWDDRASAVVPAPSAASVRVTTAVATPTVLRAPLQFARRPSEPGKSRFRLTLPGPRLPIVALELTVGGGNLLREARVTEARLANAGEVAPAPLGRATLRRAVRGTLTAAALRIPIDAPTEATIDLVVDDGDNPPLELTAVTALFATQPYIYFESDSAQRLTARFGLPGVAAPRYDLEAMREAAPALAMAEARWGALRDQGEARVERPAASGAGAGAPIDPGTFRYARPISAAGSGLATLALDTAVLAHSTLADLRIVGPGGEQLPYLLERLDEPYTVELAPLARTGRDGDGPRAAAAGTRSYYRLRLPYAQLPAARLVLRTESRVFDRRVAVEIVREPAEGRRDRRVERVADATWRHADPETPPPALTLALPSLDVAEAVVVVDEGDNRALPLERPTLLLPAYRLRYFRDTSVVASLVYGRADLGAPRYDIALLAPRLLGAAAEEVTMGPERQAPPAAADVLPTWIFWGVLAGAVLALLLLIARLVRQSDAPPAAPPPPAPAVEGTA